MSLNEESLYYFGTSLNAKGHYFWEVTQKGLTPANIPYASLPFDVESLPAHPKGGYSYFPDGHCASYKFGDISVIAISGSCADHRPNSRTVFFTKRNLNTQQLWEWMVEFNVVKEMISKMDFRIKTEFLEIL